MTLGRNMESKGEWLDQLADLIIDCFLWEWKSGRLAQPEKDSYTNNVKQPDVDKK